MNEKDMQKRKKYSELLNKKQEIIDSNRKHNYEINKEKNIEKENIQQQKEEIRRQRKLVFKQQEELQIQEIIDKLDDKEKKIILNMGLKINELSQKHLKNEKASKQAHLKMQTYREMTEKKKLEQFIKKQYTTTNQFEEFDKLKEQKILDLEKKKIKHQQKVEQNKQKLEEFNLKKLQSYSKILEEQGSQIHSQFDDRLQQQINKNRERVDKVISQCAVNLRDREEKQNKIMDRILKSQQRAFQLKQEQESLKEEGIKQHFLTKQMMIDVVMHKKKSK